MEMRWLTKFCVSCVDQVETTIQVPTDSRWKSFLFGARQTRSGLDRLLWYPCTIFHFSSPREHLLLYQKNWVKILSEKDDIMTGQGCRYDLFLFRQCIINIWRLLCWITCRRGSSGLFFILLFIFFLVARCISSRSRILTLYAWENSVWVALVIAFLLPCRQWWRWLASKGWRTWKRIETI